MAPTLLGKHAELVCPRCGFDFVVDAEETAVPELVACPNCGRAYLRADEVQTHDGDRVTIDSTPFLRHGVRRFDVVAFNVPEGSGQLAVKRVIGLPGEQVAISHGELFIDGRLLVKNVRQQAELELLVHDAAFRQAPAWHPAQQDSAWKTSDEREPWLFAAARGEDSAHVDWLEFHPAGLNFPGDARPPAPRTLLDNDAYNPALARELNPVFDSTLNLTATVSPESVVAIRGHDGNQAWQLLLERTSRATLLRDGEPVVAASLTNTNNPLRIRFAIIDGRIRITVNHQQLFDESAASPAQRRAASPIPWAIGVRQGAVRIEQLTVTRDVFYLDPSGLARPWVAERPLAAGEYFLLGDNPPVSTDSRHFGSVRRVQLRGVIQKLPTR
jgi:signal peptidase I